MFGIPRYISDSFRISHISAKFLGLTYTFYGFFRFLRTYSKFLKLPWAFSNLFGITRTFRHFLEFFGFPLTFSIIFLFPRTFSNFFGIPRTTSDIFRYFGFWEWNFHFLGRFWNSSNFHNFFSSFHMLLRIFSDIFELQISPISSEFFVFLRNSDYLRNPQIFWTFRMEPPVSSIKLELFWNSSDFLEVF